MRDLAIELRVARAKDLTHPADADAGDDFIGTEAAPGVRANCDAIIWAGRSRGRDLSCLTPQGQFDMQPRG